MKSLSLVILAGLIAATAHGLADDPIVAKLDKAKAKYAADKKKVADEAEKYFDVRETAARKAARDNKQLLNKVDDERKAFASYGILGDKVPPALKRQTAKCAEDIEKAYKIAVNEYIRAKKDDDARRLEEEWKAMRADGLFTVAPAGELFAPLFNGVDLKGWNEQSSSGNWVVVDRTLRATVGKQKMYLTTQAHFADFHLRLEFMYTPNATSWVSLRSCGDGAQSVWLVSSANINTGGVEVWNAKKKQTGFIGHAPAPMPPANEWHKVEVVARGQAITTWLNGEKRVECVDEAKTVEKGTITLVADGEGQTVRFRNLEILPLSPPPELPPSKK